MATHRHIEEYDHLNDPDHTQGEITLRISLDDLAEKVLQMNYGLTRFLSALNRVVRDPKNSKFADYQKEEVEAIVKAFEGLPR